MAKETPLVAVTPKELGHYVLKEAAKHSFVQDGEIHNVVGDGKGTIPLTTAQAAAFKDKLVSNEGVDEAVGFVTEDAAEAAATGEPQHGASSGASGASSGIPEPATAEAAKATETDKPSAPKDGVTK